MSDADAPVFYCLIRSAQCMQQHTLKHRYLCTGSGMLGGNSSAGCGGSLAPWQRDQFTEHEILKVNDLATCHWQCGRNWGSQAAMWKNLGQPSGSAAHLSTQQARLGAAVQHLPAKSRHSLSLKHLHPPRQTPQASSIADAEQFHQGQTLPLTTMCRQGSDKASGVGKVTSGHKRTLPWIIRHSQQKKHCGRGMTSRTMAYKGLSLACITIQKRDPQHAFHEDRYLSCSSPQHTKAKAQLQLTDRITLYQRLPRAPRRLA